MEWHQILGLFYLLAFLLSSLPFGSPFTKYPIHPPLHPCPHDQRDALLQFKNSFGLDGISSDHCDFSFSFVQTAKTFSWDKGTDCCGWDGVTCGIVTGNVIGLDLSCRLLRGALHSNSSLLLPKLEVLELSSSNLTEFPYFLNSLKSLTYLDLSSNSISGEIPRWFLGINHDTLEILYLSSNLLEGGIQHLQGKRLSTMYLEDNNFTDEIPSSICQLSSLSILDLSNNNLSRMPPCFGNITNLEHLDLSNNNFQGPLPTLPPSTLSIIASHSGFIGEIPPSICQLSSLLVLDLSNNNLLGNIPPCLGNITNLNDLDLSGNKFQGSLPRSLVNCAQLSSLSLGYNEFNDIFPYWLEALPLGYLDLQSNKFHGRINLTVFGLSFPALVDLLISNNNFTGRWPNWVFSNTSLEVVDLSNNKFGGSIPIPSPITLYYSIASNYITGKIPSFVCNATMLKIIILSNNNLSGSLPKCLANFSTYLSILNLRMNHLEGTIPQSFSSENSLTTLDLSQNQFEGTLPRSLTKCKYMEVLDLSGNHIEDTFPRWLGTLPKMKVLVLRSNNFKGLLNITKGALLFPKLRILDLSRNNFSGPLPANLIMNLEGMMNRGDGQDESLYMTQSFQWMSENSVDWMSYENSVTVTMKGREIKLVKILTIFTTIDLSHNSFQGEIPKVFGNLHSLVGLNLSHNHLRGSIPLTLGNLTDLGWLDLSFNKLSGGIPRVLGDLASLGYLDLSNNQLTGRVPQDKQLSTFSNDSFSGNPKLCGTPLSKACLGDAPPPPPSSSSTFDRKRCESWFKQKIVWIGYASGIVIGISIAYIAFETRRPKWLARDVIMLERRAAKWMEKKRRKAIKFHGQ